MPLFDVDANGDLLTWEDVRASYEHQRELERVARLVQAQQLHVFDLPRSGPVIARLTRCVYCECEIAVAAPYIGKLHCCSECSGREAA